MSARNLFDVRIREERSRLSLQQDASLHLERVQRIFLTKGLPGIARPRAARPAALPAARTQKSPRLVKRGRNF